MSEKERKVASTDKYEEFKERIKEILEEAGKPLTWTQIKEKGNFKQKFPNNVWVRNMEKDIGLIRERIKGKMHWKLKD